MFLPSIHNHSHTASSTNHSHSTSPSSSPMSTIQAMVDMLVRGGPGVDAAAMAAMANTGGAGVPAGWTDLFMANPDIRNELMQLFGLAKGAPAAMEAGARSMVEGKDEFAKIDVDAIFGDDSLSQTDKLALFLYAVLEAMSQDEQNQAKNVADLMNGQGDVDGQSVDVETMKLGRITDKRGQMLDLITKIIEKRNESVDKINQDRR